SLLARWQAEDRPAEKQQLAVDVQKLLLASPPADAKHPDAVLHRQLTSLSGPLFARAHADGVKPAAADGGTHVASSDWGLDRALFGRHPNGSPIEAGS